MGGGGRLKEWMVHYMAALFFNPVLEIILVIELHIFYLL